MSSIIDNVDYGPLAQLIGKWIGAHGVDIAPDNQAQVDKKEFIDEIIFTPSGPAENAEEQQLVSLEYRHQVRRLDNGLIFHQQIGHWIYEAKTGLVMHSLSIPRAVTLLAGGEVSVKGEETSFSVKAVAGSETFGIAQSPFMIEKAKTKAFEMELNVKDNKLSYREVTSLFIYGKDFEHVDSSELQRVTYDSD